MFGEEVIYEKPRETKAVVREHGTELYFISFKVSIVINNLYRCLRIIAS